MLQPNTRSLGPTRGATCNPTSQQVPTHQVSEPLLLQPPVPEDKGGHNHVAGPRLQVFSRILGAHAAAQLQTAWVGTQRAQRGGL